MRRMTYERAIEIISSRICYNLLGCMDGICKHTDKKPCAVQMAREALKEKADQEKKQREFADRVKEWGAE